MRPSADQGDFRKWIRRGLHDSALAAMQVYKNRGPDMILVILKGKPDNPLYHVGHLTLTSPLHLMFRTTGRQERRRCRCQGLEPGCDS